MSKFIKAEVPENCEILNTGDWHVGAKAFHAKGAEKIVAWVEAKPDRFLTFGGDALEGKMINSPNFNPKGLSANLLDIHSQADYFAGLLKPIADRVLIVTLGNHELYLLKDFDVVRYICKEMGRPEIQGDYQTWLVLNNALTLHFWHGRPVLPRGAKDPIQREANQKAWLKNRLAPLCGSAQAQYMGHTHSCLIVPPIEQYALVNHAENVHGVYFVEQPREINGEPWVPPDARWYVNTGSLRRAGGFDYVDYCEIAGYQPQAMAYTITKIENNRIKDIRKVVV